MFQAPWGARLQAVTPPAPTRPVRVCRQDERRFALLPVRRRRLPAWGVPPMGAVQHLCAWGDGSGAVEPTTGARFVLAWPSLHAARGPLFVDAFARTFPDRRHLLLLDNSRAHTAHQVPIPAHVRLVY